MVNLLRIGSIPPKGGIPSRTWQRVTNRTAIKREVNCRGPLLRNTRKAAGYNQ